MTTSFSIVLKEYDGAGNPDETIGELTRINGNADITWEGIDQWVDGDNNEAEFYLAITQASPYGESITGEGFD